MRIIECLRHTINTIENTTINIKLEVTKFSQADIMKNLIFLNPIKEKIDFLFIIISGYLILLT
jgi:hypothetical protein